MRAPFRGYPGNTAASEKKRRIGKKKLKCFAGLFRITYSRFARKVPRRAPFPFGAGSARACHSPETPSRSAAILSPFSRFAQLTESEFQRIIISAIKIFIFLK
jgi:hypothetical protein